MAVRFLSSFLEIISSKHLSCFFKLSYYLKEVEDFRESAVLSLLPRKFLCLPCYIVINECGKLRRIYLCDV
jgi:hypothetical protein